MTNSPRDVSEIATRLHRLTGLNQTQIDSLSQSLDPIQVDQISDALLAQLVNGSLPGLPVNPSGGLPLGLPGAVQGARFAGGTTSGAPTSGSFLVRDWVVDGSGAFFVCTVAGSPGTWVQAGGGGGSTRSAFTSVKTSAYTAADRDIVPCNTTSGTFAVTLPNLAANSRVAVKWKTGTTAPTVVAGTSASLDPTWPGFAAVGDSADFVYDGSMWNYL